MKTALDAGSGETEVSKQSIGDLQLKVSVRLEGMAYGAHE
jgi:hypothetical protein